MEVKVKDKCILCENEPLVFSAKEKSVSIPGGLFFSIGKIPVKECKKCLEVYEDEITVKDYKVKILTQLKEKLSSDQELSLTGQTCFWIRQAIFLSREELANYENESFVKEIEQENKTLSLSLMKKLEFFIDRFLIKSSLA